jgi:hypothetical protein
LGVQANVITQFLAAAERFITIWAIGDLLTRVDSGSKKQDDFNDEF